MGQFSRAAFTAACVAVGAASAWTSVAAEEPMVRAFDVATIERLGREIYDQDQLAWKATDVVFAARGGATGAQRDGLGGWIAGMRDGKPIVRFIKQGGDRPEALYDVVFDANGGATLSTPADTALTPDEIGQFEARKLALKGAANKCSNRYNTVALKDPEGDGWLVWALAATVDPDAIIIGGHLRFTVSADGKTVRAREELSKTCITFSKREAQPQSGAFGGLMLNHVVSLTPLETHVFSNLAYGMTIYVGTLNGVAWKVERGRVVTVDMADADPDGFIARALAGLAERCAAIATKRGEQPPRYYTTSELKVISATEGDRKFMLELGDPWRPVSVVCVRLDIVPAPNDYKVLAAGLALYIGDKGVGRPQRMGVLEVEGGRVRFRIEEGPPLTDELAARVAKRVESFQAALGAQVARLIQGEIARPQVAAGMGSERLTLPVDLGLSAAERAAHLVRREVRGEGLLDPNAVYEIRTIASRPPRERP